MSNNKTNTNTNNNMKGVQTMSKTNTRLTEAMSWRALKERYFIGEMRINDKVEKINQLADAINNGEIDKMAAECAEQLHGGDLYSVYTAWSKNLSSMQTNMKKKPYLSNATAEWTRYNTLRDYVSKKMSELKGSGRSGNSKAYWQWTVEEINAIPVSDLRTIKSVYDNMASKRSKYPELVASDPTFAERSKAASVKYSAAKKYAAEQQAAEQEVKIDKAVLQKIDKSLLAKLSKGSNASLSKAEAAVLAEILKALTE